jgi:hypothetical protein
MKKISCQLSILFAAILVFAACKKELSVEGSGFGGVAKGALTDSSGNCKNATVKGNYVVDYPLSDSNYVLISVNFTQQGKYKIYSDTPNGIWFTDSGYALRTGATTIKLKGKGKPILPQESTFILAFSGSYCSFKVTAITGGNSADYFPNTFGSSWAYQYTPPVSTDNNGFTTTVLPNTYNLDNKTYFEFQQVDLKGAKNSYYFAKDGLGTHYAFSTIDFDYVSLFDSIVPPAYISYPFLKENAIVNETWETPEQRTAWYQGVPGKAKAIFTLAQKNVPYTVSGQVLANVIDIKREIWFQPSAAGSVYKKLMEGHSYYAKGIGLVDQALTLPSGKQLSITAKSWTIK